MTAAPLILLKPEKRQFRTLGVEAAKFIEAFCILGSGDSYGDPFILRPWQKKILYKMFELEFDERSRTWRRRYGRALLGLPSGSGKTPFAAAIGMWFLCSDQHRDPSVACSAASKEQSGLVYGNARTMAEGDKLRKYLETGRDLITRKGAPGKLYRVSAAEGTNDGQVISCLIKDEYHEWSDTKNTDAILTKATTKIQSSFQLAITTAGYDLDTICGKLYQHGKAIERGEERDDRFFFHWVEADEDADLDDEDVWRRVHPAVEDFISMDALRDKRRELSSAAFRRYYYNNWGSVENMWLEPGMLDACRGQAGFVEGEPVWLAWDGSQKRDSTAVVAIQRGVDENEKPIVKVKPRIWNRPRTDFGKPDETWRVPQKEVMDYIRDQGKAYDLHVGAYDPQLIALYAEELADEGLPMVEFPQSPSRMAEATQMLYTLIADGTLVLSEDDADEETRKLIRHINNAVYEPLRTGGGRLVKGKAKNKMDGAIALAMAVWSMMKEEERTAGPDVGSMLYI